jgi:pimeloyl-ACP methyl ester carboxylesterase
VFDADLGHIRVPVLVVHHKDDACRATAYPGAVYLTRVLSGSREKELIAIDGGSTPHADPCEPYHYHGFVGREREVVKIISDWIKAHSTRPTR